MFGTEVAGGAQTDLSTNMGLEYFRFGLWLFYLYTLYIEQHIKLF